MNNSYIIFKDGKLQKVTIRETNTGIDDKIIATKTIEQLKKQFSSGNYVNDVVYQMVTVSWQDFGQRYAYNWKVIQSQYSDNSSLNDLHSCNETMGAAIKRMLDDGFTVTVNGVEVENKVEDCLIVDNTECTHIYGTLQNADGYIDQKERELCLTHKEVVKLDNDVKSLKEKFGKHLKVR